MRNEWGRSVLTPAVALLAAGQTWRDLEYPGEGSIIDVTVGIDRKNLFVGTGKGIWRLSLAPGA